MPFVCEFLKAFEHGMLVGREILPWLGSQDGFDSILWRPVLLACLVKLLGVGEEQGASRIRFCALAAQNNLLTPGAAPLWWDEW